ncbi:MAG: hypothetical protein R2780_03145 [Crocinitomicaceae bacterium]|nr:hypothetical protein [Crocinitomicaceae bacterium]
MKHLFSIILLSTALITSAEEVELNTIKLFNGSIEIDVPKEFKSLAEGQFKSFYTAETMPKLVYANEAKDVRIAFDSKSLSSKESDLPRVTATVKAGLEKLHPKSKMKDTGINVINGHKVSFIDYMNKKPEKFFELMFFATYKGQVMSCTFHSPKKGYKPWKEVAYKIMDSFKIIK